MSATAANAATASAAPLNLSHLQWRAAEWLLAFGPLTRETVMDYFVLSPFFDRTSNNATLRMQMMFSRGGMEGVDEQAELSKFVGTEYVVVKSQPPGLFVIHKRERISPTEATTTAVFYVLNDSIYQSPSLYAVVNERILTSLHALSSSLSLVRQRKPRWTPEHLYQWDIKPPPASSSAAATATISLDDKVPANGHEDASVASAAVKGEAATAAVVDRDDDDDDDAQRPSTAFNPLLFRALQTVASQMPDPPPAPVEPVRPTATTAAAAAAASAKVELDPLQQERRESSAAEDKTAGVVDTKPAVGDRAAARKTSKAAS